MATVFLFCLFLVIYTYLGYGIVLYLMVKTKRLFGHYNRGFFNNECLPDVTLMVCAYNEEDIVEKKMNNTKALDYPKEKLHILWVTDGSNDSTNQLLKQYPEVSVAFRPERKGKTAALNHGIKEVYTDIVVMTDANTMLNSEAITIIVKEMADPKVGCVAGEKRVVAHNGNQAAEGEGLYWKYESTLKRLDSELNSAMGAAGELCAIRSALYEEMPEDTLLDDFILSMNILSRGYRIAYTSEAYAMENGSTNLKEESKRKKRIAAGGLQSCWRLKKLMNPIKYPLTSFQFVSHRVLRWTVTPIALIMLIPLNVILVISNAGTFYTTIWILQLMFYFSAAAGMVLTAKGKHNRLLYIAYYFLFMNMNVFKGIAYLAKKQGGTWEKSKRA
ncbi:MAG: glycosyltransferase family 2 protein [Prevotella sp.]|nr:glycosyltransferase family 2 protein [Prevotella sp.]MDD5896454.1 glycosyltransferase family 2 protein [Prevotellaceae bacterium]